MLLLSAHQLELAAEANALLECKVTLTTTAAAAEVLLPVLNVVALLLLVLIVPLLLWCAAGYSHCFWEDPHALQ